MNLSALKKGETALILDFKGLSESFSDDFMMLEFQLVLK